MTGRDLILYILANGLEDEPVFKDGTFIGFETIEAVAARSKVGIATVQTWIQTGHVKTFKIGDVIYIPIDTTL